MVKKIRIGLLNLMPEAEKYEKYLMEMFAFQTIHVETVWIKATQHAYKSSDKKQLEKVYVTFGQAIEKEKLDGLIITGAPVETLPFETITYWNELIGILDYSQQHIISTMGICWGGIAIGKYLGIDNKLLDEKLFGVFSSEYLQKEHWITDSKHTVFDCPQSRYASMDENALIATAKNGNIRLLVNSEEAGIYVFESADGRFLAHLGHPEYDTDRIVSEYKRDALKGLNHIPLHFDVNHPVNTWQQNGKDFFGKWLEMISLKKNLK